MTHLRLTSVFALPALAAAVVLSFAGPLPATAGEDVVSKKPSEASTPASKETPWSTWRSLRLEARKLLFFSGAFEMTLRDENDKRYLETSTVARFFGAELTRSRSVTTIDIATGRTLDYYELSTKRGRHYRFDDTGFAVDRLEPANGPDAPLARWEVTSTERFSYPPAAGEGETPPVVHSYYGLFLALRGAHLDKPEDEVTLWVATSKGPQPFRIRVTDVRTTERTFEDRNVGRKRRLPVREFRLRVSPADPARADEGFMKMEGDTEIRVEAWTRTLLEVSGKIPRVPGRVEVELEEIR